MKKAFKNAISEGAAVKLLNRLYAPYKDKNEISLEEIYEAAGRAEIDPETNRNWFNGVLAKLKMHNFVETATTFENSRNKVVGMKLTMAGEFVLGRRSETPIPGQRSGSAAASLTLDEMLAAVEELRKKYTAFDIELIIKPKETPMQ